MIEAPDLRDAIATALDGQIGTYNFGGVLTTPAIRIDDGSSPYDQEPTVTGLEVVIVPSLDVAVKPLMGGYQQTFGTTIVLKQWNVEETTMTAMDSVLEAIAQFSTLGVGQLRRVIRSSKLDNIETMVIPVSETALCSTP